MLGPARHRTPRSGALTGPDMVALAKQQAAAAAARLPGVAETTSLIAEKFVAHAAPVIQQDKELQKTMGAAAGAAAAQHLSGPVTLAALAVTFAAGVAAWKMLA